jgi:class 3 adenylate cyclase
VVHRGPALVANFNDHLDYFGTTVLQATELLQRARGGEVILSEAVLSDPQAAALLGGHGRGEETLRLDLPGQPGAVVHRVTP